METLLRFSHATTDPMVNVELQAASELADPASVEAFSRAYGEFGVVDLWLNVPDVEQPAVVHKGLLGLREETLACGVPLGMFVMGEVIEAGLAEGATRQLVLCKANDTTYTRQSKHTLPDLRMAAYIC